MTESFQMLAISPVHHYILGLHLVWASRCTALIFLDRALPKRVNCGLQLLPTLTWRTKFLPVRPLKRKENSQHFFFFGSIQLANSMVGFIIEKLLVATGLHFNGW